MKLTKIKLRDLIKEELSVDDVKNASKILGAYTKNILFGNLKWTDDGRYKTADVTKLVKPPFDIIFKKIDIRCSSDKNKKGEEYYSFDFRYSHPDGGSNGISIGTVLKKPNGERKYKKA